MRDLLVNFFLIDDGSRWRAILWSWLAGSIAGAIAATSTDSLNRLAFVSVAISLVTFGGLVFSYTRATRERVAIVESRRAFMDYAYAAIATCFFVTLERILTNPETVHAAAIHIGNNIDGKTPVREDQITAARAALEIIAKREPSPALKQQITSDYSVVSAASAYNVALKEISEHPERRIEGLNLRLTHLTGSHGAFRVNESWMIEDVTVIAEESISKGVIIGCTSCAVIVLRGSFEHLTQELDFGTWFKCRFINCDISYMGGQVVMVQCEFDSCTFRFAASVSSKLREVIESGTVVVPAPSGLQ